MDIDKLHKTSGMPHLEVWYRGRTVSENYLLATVAIKYKKRIEGICYSLNAKYSGTFSSIQTW